MGDQSINPWRERLGNQGWIGGVEPADLSRIFGVKHAKEGGIPFVPQRAVMYEVVPEASPKPERVVTVKAPATLTPRARVRAFITDWLAERYPAIPLAAVIGRASKWRSARFGNLHIARREVINAVKAANPAWSTPMLGKVFEVDHTTIVYALNVPMRTRHNARNKAAYLAAKAARA